jgi:hypothetical protein
MGRQAKQAAALALAVIAGAAGRVHAQSAPVPDTISPPKALNLGSTSFFDGFGRTDEGWTWLQYARFEDLGRITDADGHDVPYFKDPSIRVFSALIQICYTTDLHPFGGDAIGFMANAPLISLNTSFAADSPVKLSNNGFGIGDLVWGPSYQSRILTANGHPVFGWRLQFAVMSPTGTFNKNVNINQGAGYWGVNPYIAATYLPVPGLEFSTRLNYQYNFKSTNFSDPPPIPGLVYRNGQAGQIVYDNLDASYQVADKIHLGVNGYVLAQLNPDRTNGQIVPRSRETEIYAGPGGRYVFHGADALNVNLYLPVMSHNGSPGPQVNFQYVHRF